MQQGLASEEAHITDAAPVQNVERVGKPLGIYPAQFWHAPAREIAEVTGGVAGICNCDVAQPRAASPNHAQHIPGLCYLSGHISLPESRPAAPSALPAIRFRKGQQVCTGGTGWCSYSQTGGANLFGGCSSQRPEYSDFAELNLKCQDNSAAATSTLRASSSTVIGGL